LRILLLALILLLPSLALAGERLHLEKEYQAAWCTEGTMEFVLDDKARVDCLTDEYAVEFDFANKWAEAVGQALYYGIKTERKPGIVLILEKDTDKGYLERLQTVAEKFNLKVWTVTPELMRSCQQNRMQ